MNNPESLLNRPAATAADIAAVVRDAGSLLVRSHRSPPDRRAQRA
jgi:hypothetical protein